MGTLERDFSLVGRIGYNTLECAIKKSYEHQIEDSISPLLLPLLVSTG